MVPSGKTLLNTAMAAALCAFMLQPLLPAEGAVAGAVPGQVIVEEGGGSSSPPPPPCSVSVRMTTTTATALTHAGSPRSNPDGTYYPGDAFLVSLQVGSQNCAGVSTSISGDSALSVACPGCASTRVDVLPSVQPGSYAVRASVHGTGPGGSGSASATMSISVADPMITIRVVPADVADADGYLMRNADGTYYANDAVALRYEVDYRFKDARRGVVEPEVTATATATTRIHPYPKIADMDCLQDSCTLVVPATAATSEYRATFGHATGISVANATAQQGPGPKDFLFEVRLKNAGVLTEMKAKHTHTVLVVDYNPVFAAAYPYLNLRDGGGDMSYEKKLMIGLHYLGSLDPDGEVKPLRRAKINMYTNQVSALVVGSNVTDVTERAGLTWLSTSGFSGNLPETTVTETAPGSHAVIERAGHAKIAMELAGYDRFSFVQMLHVTASPAFYSSAGFAGRETVRLFDAVYAYPGARLANTITVKVTGGDTAAPGSALGVQVGPAEGAASVCDYYDKHALNATGDPVFSKMVLSDVYSCSGAFLEGAGAIEVRANMTAVLVPKIYETLYPGGLAAMPHDVVLSFPSSLSLRVSVSETGATAAHDLVIYAHDRDLELVANVGQRNLLEVVRDGGAVVVKSPAGFGAIAGLQVNGATISQACTTDQCMLDIPSSATIIVATNQWGGRASAVVDAPVSDDGGAIASVPDVLAENSGGALALAISAAVGAAVAGAVFRRYASLLGDAFC